jgi:hypothetical protein
VASVAVERVRRLIDGLRRDRRMHPYRGRCEYSQLAREVVAACEVLIESEPASVPALAQRAVDLVTTALMYVDDSSGIVGDDDLHALMAVHARACAATPPDPKRLAAWLGKVRLEGPGWPDFELRDYAGALGEKGRAELARLVEDRAKATEPDLLDRTPWGIQVLREQLAEISGDIDHYIAVWGSRSRPAALTCVISALGRQGMIRRYVAAPAVFGLPAAGEPAVAARSLLGVQGRRTPGTAS